MRKSIQAILFESLLVPSLSRNHHSNPRRSLFLSITASFSFNHNRFCSTTPDLNPKNSVLASYLIGSLKFSRDRAHSVCKRRTRSIENPKEVVHFLKGFGLSDAHIQSIAHGAPSILFANVEKNLKPKVIFFRELGLTGTTLCSLISGNHRIFHHSLDRVLKPCVHFISKILISDGRYKSKEQFSDALVRILKRCNEFASMKSRLEANILYLESCGAAGSQLSTLLVRQTRILCWRKEKLEDLVSRAVDMKFTRGSRMLAHAIRILSDISIKTLNGRFEVLRMFGFSKDEVAAMFRSTPNMFGLADENLRRKLDFFLNNLKIDKLVLVRNPSLLGLSLDGRVIPRSKVVEILKSRWLLEEGFSFRRALFLSNQQFLEKYILPFKDDVKDQVLEAYKGKLVDTSKK